MINNMIAFRVYGIPIPKQSFRYSGRSRGYTPKHIKDWQDHIRQDARNAVGDAGWLEGELYVSLVFYLPDHRRKDLDNLSKVCLDAMNGVVYGDDQQITELNIAKVFNGMAPGVDVEVMEKAK